MKGRVHIFAGAPVFLRVWSCWMFTAALTIFAAEPKLLLEDEEVPGPQPGKDNSAAKGRLEWNLKTLVGACDRIGRKDQRWDEAARKALNEFARIRTYGVGEGAASLTGACREAIRQGCDDPLMLYLRARHLPSLQPAQP